MDGFLNILKPPGMTSHDVVDLIRKKIPGVKTGHGGTLDPGAAGVLPLLLGKATKLSPYILKFPKVYRAELHLGISTDTADSFGKITGRSDPPPLNKDDLQSYAASLVGEIEQLPPMYSAVKSRGKKLYEYARRGENVERIPRRVTIHDLKVVAYFPPQKSIIEIKCSSGTYVRTLCEQIGDLLGCGGHMSFLVRTACGGFHIAKAISLEELVRVIDAGRFDTVLFTPDFPFGQVKRACLNKSSLRCFYDQKSITLDRLLQEEVIDITDPVDGHLVAVYTREGEFAALGRLEAISENKFALKLEKTWKH